MDKADAQEKVNNVNDELVPDVGNLLINLGLDLITCGDEARIWDNDELIGQLDLVFKDKESETIFLIEVSTLQRNRALKINHFFSRWEEQQNISLCRSQFQLPPTYNIVRLYFDLKGNKCCPPSVINIVERDNNHFLNDYIFEYFNDAYGKVGKWARYDFLSYLDIKPRTESAERRDAIQFYLGENIRSYAYVDSVKKLLQYCYVSRRKKEGIDKGYQRVLQKERINKIAKKIQNPYFLAFPNALLISSPDQGQLCRDPKQINMCPCHVDLWIPDYFCACRIVDGQHRLLSFANLPDDYQESHFIPVIVLENIQQLQEMRTFVEINSGQKRIDKNLILVLAADFDWDVDENEKEYFEKQAVQISTRLNSDSPLRYKIYIPEVLAKKKGKITLATLVSAIYGNNFIGKRVHLYQKNYRDITSPFTKIKNALILTRKNLPQYCEGKSFSLFSNIGIRILFRLIQVFERNRIKKNLNVQLNTFFVDLGKVLNDKMIIRIEDSYGEGGANKAVEEICKKIKRQSIKRYKKLETDLRKI